jgi:hypothetical protein
MATKAAELNRHCEQSEAINAVIASEAKQSIPSLRAKRSDQCRHCERSEAIYTVRAPWPPTPTSRL